MKKEKEVKTSKLQQFLSSLSDKTANLKKKDWMIIGIFVLIGFLISFYRLGTLSAPQTYYQFTYEGDNLGIEIPGDSQEISKIRYYTGPEVGEFSILGSEDGETFEPVTTFTSAYVFSWEDVTIDVNLKYIKFVGSTVNSYLGEVQLYDQYGERVLAKATDDQSEVIVDEAETVPAQISFLNSSYFDEIYFARSAYEYTQGIDTMEWTHPPLGKLIMMIPILLFGMNPFSYRLMGALAGIFMIPVIYILAKKIFKSRKWAMLAGALMTFDTFRLAQTRMGTVDSFLVLFIMLAALFMFDYISLDSDAKLKKKLKYLFLSGLFMGLSIAVKWTGLYAGLALAIIFFVDTFYKNSLKNKKKSVEWSRNLATGLFIACVVPIAIYYITTLVANASLATLLTVLYYIVAVGIGLLYYIFKIDRDSLKVILPCILFFLIIPCVIYILCYVLFPNVYGYTNGITGIIDQIKNMFNYHSTLVATHDFSSNWYTWPLMIKPVWYYVGYYGGNIKSTIVGIGNPAIWWFGTLAMIYTVIRAITTRKKEILFILVFILCTFLPYLFIGRVMFMYHYFPTLPFVILAIVAFVRWITGKLKNNSFYFFYIALVILMFLIFYPIASGMLTTTDYIDSLKWLSSWIF